MQLEAVISLSHMNMRQSSSARCGMETRHCRHFFPSRTNSTTRTEPSRSIILICQIPSPALPQPIPISSRSTVAHCHTIALSVIRQHPPRATAIRLQCANNITTSGTAATLANLLSNIAPTRLPTCHRIGLHVPRLRTSPWKVELNPSAAQKRVVRSSCMM